MKILTPSTPLLLKKPFIKKALRRLEQKALKILVTMTPAHQPDLTLFNLINPPGRGGYLLELGTPQGLFNLLLSAQELRVDTWEKNFYSFLLFKILKRLTRSKKSTCCYRPNPQKRLQSLQSDHYDYLVCLDFHPKKHPLPLLLEKASCLILGFKPHYEQQLRQPLENKPLILQHLGHYPQLDSKNPLTLYRIQKKTVQINQNIYHLQERKYLAHATAGHLDRSYLDCGTVFIKKYRLLNKSNQRQKILQEIKLHQQLPANPFFPKLLDYRLNHSSIDLVFEKLPGENLNELLVQKRNLPPLYSLIAQIIEGLRFLKEQGFYYNDLRTWNILLDGEKIYLLDLGLADKEEKENTKLALLWVLSQLLHYKEVTLKWPISCYPEDLGKEVLEAGLQELIEQLEEEVLPRLAPTKPTLS